MSQVGVNQPIFAALKQSELTCVVPLQSALYLPCWQTRIITNDVFKQNYVFDAACTKVSRRETPMIWLNKSFYKCCKGGSSQRAEILIVIKTRLKQIFVQQPAKKILYY